LSASIQPWRKSQARGDPSAAPTIREKRLRRIGCAQLFLLAGSRLGQGPQPRASTPLRASRAIPKPPQLAADGIDQECQPLPVSQFVRSSFCFCRLNRLVREHVGTSYRGTKPYPQIYPRCGYAVNKFYPKSPDALWTVLAYFSAFYGSLWIFLEGGLVPQRGFEHLTHALRIRRSLA
jgi:hypothetical protein